MGKNSDNKADNITIGKKPAYRVLAEREGKKPVEDDRIKSGTMVTVKDPDSEEVLYEGMVLGMRENSKSMPSPAGQLSSGKHYFVQGWGWAHADGVS